MLNYHSRPATSIQEDYEYSKMDMEDIVDNNIHILGPKGDCYTNRIVTFAEGNSVNGKHTVDKKEGIDNIIVLR